MRGVSTRKVKTDEDVKSKNGRKKQNVKDTIESSWNFNWFNKCVLKLCEDVNTIIGSLDIIHRLSVFFFRDKVSETGLRQSNAQLV
jgi:hypothetical protein